MSNSTERVYTGKRGRVAHILPGWARAEVLCGLWAFGRSDWFGTGSQDEYERAATLPLCKNCLRRSSL